MPPIPFLDLFLMLTGILLLAYALLIGYAWYGWKRVPVFQPMSGHLSKPISIIIAARSEEGQIGECLESLLAQDFSSDMFEVIVADDHSEDRTVQVVQSYADRGLPVRVLVAGAGDAEGKKAAITRGIAAATHELIATTDADCRFPKQWLRTLSDFQSANHAEFVAAPVKLTMGRSFLDRFQSLDFLTLQGITAVAVHHGWFNMCNGANLMYTRTAFQSVKGFEGIDRVASGDDMLLMEKIGRAFPGKIGYCLSPDAVVETAPAADWRAFLQQRIRWASKSALYRSMKIKLVLLLVYLVNLGLTTMLLGMLLKPEWGLFAGIGFLCKWLVEWPFTNSVAAFYGRKKLMTWFLLMQPFHALYTVLAGGFGLAGGYRWKGREIRR